MPILISHFSIEYLTDPEGNDYRSYDLDLQNRAKGRVHEWADIVGFMEPRINILAREGSENVISKPTGKVVLHLGKHTRFNVKQSYDLPAQIDVPKQNGWAALAEALKNSTAKKSVTTPLVNLSLVEAPRGPGEMETAQKKNN